MRFILLITMLLALTACTNPQKAYVDADAANYNATWKYTEAGIDAATDISTDDKDDLHLLQKLRAGRIANNGGVINKE